jgi:hypothetical protein
MMAVDIKAGPKLTIGTPHVLFDFIPTILGFGCDPVRCYAVAPDGQRFFVTQPVPVQPLPPVTHIRLVTGWAEEVKAKVAAGQPK